MEVAPGRATYDLAAYKAEFSSVPTIRYPQLSLVGAQALGLTVEDMMAVVQALTAADFYKTMPSNVDVAIFQDVYRPTYGGVCLYVKLTISSAGRLLISFKER